MSESNDRKLPDSKMMFEIQQPLQAQEIMVSPHQQSLPAQMPQLQTPSVQAPAETASPAEPVKMHEPSPAVQQSMGLCGDGMMPYAPYTPMVPEIMPIMQPVMPMMEQCPPMPMMEQYHVSPMMMEPCYTMPMMQQPMNVMPIMQQSSSTGKQKSKCWDPCELPPFMPHCVEYAQAYVPYQYYMGGYSPEIALSRGTMFPELFRPYQKKVR